MPEFVRDLGKITGIKEWKNQNSEDEMNEANEVEINEAIYSVKREIAVTQVQMDRLASRREELEIKQKLMLKWAKQHKKNQDKKQQLMLEERKNRQNKKKSWYEDCRLV